jgi:hypothetical protein
VAGVHVNANPDPAVAASVPENGTVTKFGVVAESFTVRP